MSSQIHSVYFLTTDGWTSDMARNWLHLHNLSRSKKVHKMGVQLRYRIMDQRLFNRFTTQKIISDGRPIYLVLGWND